MRAVRVVWAGQARGDCVCASAPPRLPPLAMASDRSLSSASGSSRAPHESPCLAMAGAGSSTTIQRLLPIRSARPRERFSDLLTMIDGKSMATLSYDTLWVFDLRARLLAQQSSLLVELESCLTRGASKLVPDGGDGRAAGVSTEPTAADLPSRVRRSPALYAVQPLPPGVWPSRTPPGWLSSRVGRPGAASPTTLPNAAVDARASAVSGLAGGRGGLPKRPHCACGRIVCWYERVCCQKRRRWPLEQPAIATRRLPGQGEGPTSNI